MELAGALRKTDRVVCSMQFGTPLVEALEQLDRFAEEVMPGSAAQRSRQWPNKVYSVIRESRNPGRPHCRLPPRQLLFLMRSLQWT
jgi:hypothetical protein